MEPTLIRARTAAGDLAAGAELLWSRAAAPVAAQPRPAEILGGLFAAAIAAVAY